MKKKIFLVFGTGAGVEMSRAQELAEKFHSDEGEINIIIDVNLETPTDALITIVERLGAENADYKNSVLLYSGNNLGYFKSDLKIPTLDVKYFKEKLIELVGGFRTPQEKYQVGCLFVGGLSKLIMDESGPE